MKTHHPLLCLRWHSFFSSFLFAWALLFGLAATSAHAATFTWEGDSSGSWGTAGNWGGSVSFNDQSDLVFGSPGFGRAVSYLGNGSASANRTARSLTYNANLGTRDGGAKFNDNNSSGPSADPNDLRLISNGSTVSITVDSGVSGNVTLGRVGNSVFGELQIADNLLLTNNGSGLLHINVPITEIGSGASTITIGGTGTVRLTGTNTFDSQVIIGDNTGSALTLQVNTINDLNVASSLGQPTTAANGVIQIGNTSRPSTLEFIGASAAASTDRQVQIGKSGGGSGGASILNNNTDPNHTLTFSNAAFNVAATGTSSFNRGLRLGGSNTGDNTIAGVIQDNVGGSGGRVGLTKQDSGTWILSGANTYTGGTTVSDGILVVNGSLESASIAVNGNGSLYGHGVLPNATLSGSGSIDPGGSPGVLTAADTNSSGGLDYNFEFTAANTLPDWDTPAASINDVLRLTDAAPFQSALDASNEVSIYLDVMSVELGDEFTGGFYTDNNADFLSSIADADFVFFIADAAGAVNYNGQTYSEYSSGPPLSISTIAQTADFGGGDVNGFSMLITAVPEPSAIAIWTLLGLGLAGFGWYRIRKIQ